MWESRVELRVHYATCRGLASQISEFMANQHSFDLSTLAAGDLTGMVTAMVKQLGETEDRWDEVVDTAKTHGPDDPDAGSLLKDWSNIVHIKGVVSDVMSEILNRRYENAYKSSCMKW